VLFLGNGIVWDKETNKQLCKFVDGKFETDDIAIIVKLKEKYMYVAEIENKIIEETKETPQIKKVKK